MFNPLDLENLGESIARAMGESNPTPLAALPRFEGAGIYAIYYNGPHPAYEPLVTANADLTEPHPIYVGKATPKGGRKGLVSPEASTALRARLGQHAKSIEDSANLELEDFQARWLVLDHVWVNLGESVLIRRHSPVWNAIVDGFGNHAPGSGRAAGKRPRWDILHEGRAWASGLRESSETAEQVTQDVWEYFAARLR